MRGTKRQREDDLEKTKAGLRQVSRIIKLPSLISLGFFYLMHTYPLDTLIDFAGFKQKSFPSLLKISPHSWRELRKHPENITVKQLRIIANHIEVDAIDLFTQIEKLPIR
ncbi:MAG: hypothetical protein AAF901_12540 [Bacteroidota bacterium]